MRNFISLKCDWSSHQSLTAVFHTNWKQICPQICSSVLRKYVLGVCTSECHRENKTHTEGAGKLSSKSVFIADHFSIRGVSKWLKNYIILPCLTQYNISDRLFWPWFTAFWGTIKQFCAKKRISNLEFLVGKLYNGAALGTALHP